MKQVVDVRINKVMIENDVGGFANCYIGLPKGHPWYEMHYLDIEKRCTETNEVHGGLTYSGDKIPCSHENQEGFWWVGFDTRHAGDNKENCDREFCEKELEKLRDIALKDLFNYLNAKLNRRVWQTAARRSGWRKSKD